MTSAQFAATIRKTRDWLAAARKSVGGRAIEWYPYDSLGNLTNLERAFGARYVRALVLAPGKVVADIGCGDGELAFFMESLGCQVDAIDFPDSNHNSMQGVRALQQQLGSRIDIVEVDIDNRFELPRPRYDLAVMLGVLYHLKNPLYVLEQLARHTRYCVLSTRVARYFPDDRPMPQHQPIAYLVGTEELNADDTNFWIFSHPGLKRLFERTYWKILEYSSVGETQLSTPIDPKRDERVFCLLESHYGLANIDLLQGWYETETGGTRWAMKRFSARINLTGRAGPDRIRMRVYLPDDHIARLGPLRLDINIDGVPAAPAILDRAGFHDIVRRFRSPGRPSVLLTCEVDKALPPDENDDRELAIVVVSLDCE
jgi:tRNA (mo5U34)-methyltransferase